MGSGKPAKSAMISAVGTIGAHMSITGIESVEGIYVASEPLIPLNWLGWGGSPS